MSEVNENYPKNAQSAIASANALATATWVVLGLLMTIGCVGSLGCRGYHLGNQFLFRSDIRTVHVAMFESNSNRRFLGQRLTEAIVKEIVNTTPLTITDPAVADSFITGRLVQERKSVVGETSTDEPRSLDVDWRIEVAWTDRVGVPLMPKRLVTIDHKATFIPEGGQSLTTAQQQVIERLAREIVGQIETPW